MTGDQDKVSTLSAAALKEPRSTPETREFLADVFSEIAEERNSDSLRKAVQRLKKHGAGA